MTVHEAIILTGGREKGLRSSVSDVPKPMARIQGKPFLEIIIETFYAKGINHFILSVSYLSETILDHFSDKYPDIQISFSVENEALGTGGAIRLAMTKLESEHALILNGDSLFDVDLNEINKFESLDTPIVFCRFVDNVNHYDHFIFDGHQVQRYSEKKKDGQGCINGGVYVFHKNLLEHFPLYHKFSIEEDVFSKFSSEKTANLIISDGCFIDIGVQEGYLCAQEELKPYIKKKALFLDRDGVINVDSGYVYTKERCLFIDGIQAFLEKSKVAGYFIVVVTNQAGIGRGYYTEEEFHDFMEWMNQHLNNLIDDYYFCPFHVEHGIGKYKRISYDRKPNPGMLLKAIKDHNISPEMSIMVGDKKTDMIAASKANIKKRFLLSDDKLPAKNDYETVCSLKEIEDFFGRNISSKPL